MHNKNVKEGNALAFEISLALLSGALVPWKLVPDRSEMMPQFRHGTLWENGICFPAGKRIFALLAEYNVKIGIDKESMLVGICFHFLSKKLDHESIEIHFTLVNYIKGEGLAWEKMALLPG